MVEAIERRGWTVWWDRKIDAGTAFDREIEKALDEANCIIVVWSEESVESDWVRNEATEGLERGILIPVLIDPVRPPLAFRRTQTIDFTKDVGSFEALLEAVFRVCPTQKRVFGNSSPLVGRDRELARLNELLRGMGNRSFRAVGPDHAPSRSLATDGLGTELPEQKAADALGDLGNEIVA